MKPWRLYAPFVSDCAKGLRYAKVYKKGDNKSFYTIVFTQVWDLAKAGPSIYITYGSCRIHWARFS